jgi:PhnB protein
MKDITTYLNFDGETREAMTFYAQCLGAELTMQSFKDANIPADAGQENRIMHARLSKGDAVIMASDTMPGMQFKKGNNFSMTIECDSAEELQSLYEALLEGGTSLMEPQDTFWGARFAMLTDKFGIGWMFNHQREQQG